MWIKTCALVYVDEIQTNCFVTNTDFAWTWLTYRYIDDLEFFRPAVFFNDDCFAHGVCS